MYKNGNKIGGMGYMKSSAVSGQAWYRTAYSVSFSNASLNISWT